MSPSTTLSRSCAQHCCRALRTQQPSRQSQIQSQIRTITSTAPSLYAQHTDLASEIAAEIAQYSKKDRRPTQIQPEASSDGEAFSHTQPELNQPPPSRPSKTMLSRLPQDQHQPPPTHMFTATVSRTGTMPQTVQLTRQHQVFDSFLQKHYTRPLRLKAHDPNPQSYLREGDVVEYGPYTQAEKDTKLAKDIERVRREEKRLEEQDKTGKAVRKFRRNEAKKKELRGKKVRGVQYVVRRVVTPFGVSLDERMEKLAVSGEGLQQERASKGGQDSLLKGRGGNMSRQSRRAAVAG